MNFYQRLRDIREDFEKTQQEIADYLHIRRQQYCKYENGKQMMGIDKYIKLAKYYNISLDYLSGIIQTPKTINGKPYKPFQKVTNTMHVTNIGNENVTIIQNPNGE